MFPAVQMSLVPVMTLHAHTLCAVGYACACFNLPGVLMHSTLRTGCATTTSNELLRVASPASDSSFHIKG